MKVRYAILLSMAAAAIVTAFQNCAGDLPSEAANWNSAQSQITGPTPTPTPVVPIPTETEPFFGAAFGGMFGYFGPSGGVYPNSVTGKASCPAGYTDTQLLGQPYKDWQIHVCTAAIAQGMLPEYDFGGVFSSTVNNPATGAKNCGAGFSSVKVYGTANLDANLNYCIRPHNADPEGSLHFAGFYGSGGAPVTYANPVTGMSSCPTGATGLQVLGGTLDNTLVSCYAVPK